MLMDRRYSPAGSRGRPPAPCAAAPKIANIAATVGYILAEEADRDDVPSFSESKISSIPATSPGRRILIPGGLAEVRASEVQRQSHITSTATGRLKATPLARPRPHRDERARGRPWSPEVADDGPIRVLDFDSPARDGARFR